MKLKSVLSIFICFLGVQSVYAVDRCSTIFAGRRLSSQAVLDLYEDYSRVDNMALRILISKNTSTRYEDFSVSDFNAYFDPRGRVIVMNQADDAMRRIILFHHESVHTTTDYKFRKNPLGSDTALAIKFMSEGILDSSLPQPYQKFFQIDEMKAFRKTGAVVAQVAKNRESVGHESAAGNFDLATVKQSYSRAIAKATHHLLSQAKLEVLEGLSGKPVEIQYYPYAEDTPHHFNVAIVIPRENQSPYAAVIPIYEPTAVNGNIPNIYPKLLKVIDEGLSLSSYYFSK